MRNTKYEKKEDTHVKYTKVVAFVIYIATAMLLTGCLQSGGGGGSASNAAGVTGVLAGANGDGDSGSGSDNSLRISSLSDSGSDFEGDSGSDLEGDSGSDLSGSLVGKHHNPEPATMALFATGLGLLAVLKRKKK